MTVIESLRMLEVHLDRHTRQVRALVLALARPADWPALSRVWHGVQVDLGLPAPAIAVAGADGYQLWFSLAEPVPAPRALAFLDALRAHYLGDIKASRIGLLPTVAALSPLQAVHAPLVPAPLPDNGHWSAFVTPDLAPVFADEPWLDSAPNPAGQSELLSRLKSIPVADFQHALDQLRPATAAIAVQPAAAPTTDHPEPAVAERNPKRFLLDVMNDSSVPLSLRIDAAKALLPYVAEPAQG